MKRFLSLLGLTLLAWIMNTGLQAGEQEYPILLSSFGHLETIAGRGTIREKDYNGWIPTMESGPAKEAELSRPHMAMADDEGNVFIADKDAHAIRMVTPDGTIHTVAGTGIPGFNGDGPGDTTQLNQPNGLYVFPDGACFILDLGNARIRKMTAPSGPEFATDITTLFQDPQGMGVGRGLWVQPDQQRFLYVSFDSSTGWSCIRQWRPQEGIETVASGFAEPGNIDVHPVTGAVYVTDRGRHRVYRIEENATLTTVAGNGLSYGGGDGYPAIESALYEVRGICFAPNGGYFVCTHAGGQVWYIDTEGILHLVIDGNDQHAHSGDGLPITTAGKKISEPRAVTLAPNGDLLITESDYGFIRRVRRSVRIVSWNMEPGQVLQLTWSSVPGRAYTIEHAAPEDWSQWQIVAQAPGSEGGITTSSVIPSENLGNSGRLRIQMR